jgi:hypothetical protein
MEASKVDFFMQSTLGKFPDDKIFLINERVKNMDDSKFPLLQSKKYKNPTAMLIISIFVGSLGIDRFILGNYALGLLKFITIYLSTYAVDRFIFGLLEYIIIGGVIIWIFVDWIIMIKSTKKKNFRKFMTVY